MKSCQIVTEQLQSILSKGVNPITSFFTELHNKYKLPVRFYTISKFQDSIPISILPKYVIENTPPSQVQCTTPLNLIIKPDTFRILTYVTSTALLSEHAESLISKICIDINEFKITTHIPISFIETKESKIYTSPIECRVQVNAVYDRWDILIKGKAGIALSMELHEKIVKDCRHCPKRLKCILIPSEECSLSFVYRCL